jgi:hypothetical protein
LRSLKRANAIKKLNLPLEKSYLKSTKTINKT